MQNLTIDYSTDTNGNILSMNYNETGGFSGELFAVSDNSGNIVAWSTILGINNYAAIRDPNNAYIDPIEIHNPNDINVPLGWNGKKGNNITIQQVGTGNDLIFNAGGSGFSITNPWGATDITDSTTTTTTDDTTDKDGGDDAEPCRDPDAPFENCMANCYEEKTGRTNWRGDWDASTEYESVMAAIESLTNEKISTWVIECRAFIIATHTLHPLFSVAAGIGSDAFLDRIRENQNKSITELKQRKNELLASRPCLKDPRTRYDAYHAIGDCYDKCKHLQPPGGDI